MLETYEQLIFNKKDKMIPRTINDSFFPFINGYYSAKIYLFKVDNRKAVKKSCKICSKLTIKIPERCHWRTYFTFFSSASIVNFEHLFVFWVGFLHLKEAAIQIGSIE